MMRPLAEFPLEARRRVRVLLTDIDDTLTQDGRLPAASLDAMERLSQAGILVIPVTGRPAGWCDHIARMWPVDAVVGENGAFYFAYDREARKMTTRFAKPEAERHRDRLRLEALREQILDAFPGTRVASDQAYRVADLAIDYCEDVEPLPMSTVDRIVELLEGQGATTKVSSIHINTWFGDYDKLSTTRNCLQDLFGVDMDATNETIVFAGDSPNDSPMFSFFVNSVGVANVRRFTRLSQPSWVTSAEAATGFAEITAAILAAQEGALCQNLHQS